MATINSAGSGNWHTGATWVGGVAPGTGDTANIMNGHTVTVAAPILGITKIIVYGNMVMNDDITMDSSDGCYIWVTDNGTWTSNATPGTPRIINQGAGGAATAQWYFVVKNSANAVWRNIDLSNIVMSRNRWWIGRTSTTGEDLSFNVLSEDGIKLMLRPSPITRDISYIEHNIDGRGTGRLYPRSKSAGRCTVRGFIRVGNAQYIGILENLKSLNQRVSLTTDIIHMGQARVESLRWGEPRGSYLPFYITLVEDI